VNGAVLASGPAPALGPRVPAAARCRRCAGEPDASNLTRESRRGGRRTAHALPAAALALAAALVAGPASAGIERAGTTAANFLSIGSGAGVLGMGGAGLALEGGLATVHWNPATLARLDWSEAVLSHAALGEQSSQDWAAFGGRLRFAGVSGAVTGLYQSEGSFEGRDALNNPTGTFDVSSIALGLGVARAVGPFVTAGLAFKYASEDLGTVRGSGVALDAGLQVRSGPFGFGAAAQNAFGRMTYDGASYDFPTSYGIGASCAHAASGLRVAFDLNFPRAYYSDIRGGVEWNWNGHLALRTGYRAELGAPADEPLAGPTFGMGTGVRGIWIDYGYQVSGGGAGQHLLGVTFHPGALMLPSSQRARGASEAGYASASAPATDDATRAKGPSTTTEAGRPAGSPSSGAAAATGQGSATAPAKTAAPASTPATTTAAVAPAKAAAPATSAAAVAPPKAAAPATTTAAVAPAKASPPAMTTTASAAPVKPAAATSPAPSSAAVTVPKTGASAGAATSLTTEAAGPVAVNLFSTRPAAPPTYVQRAKAARSTGDAAGADRKTAAADVGAGVAPRAPVAPASDARTTQQRDSTSAVKVSTPGLSAHPAQSPAGKADSAAARSGEASTSSSAQASPAASERKPRPEKVRVKSGETMADIAARYGTSVPAIMMENNLVSDRARPGQVLRLPRK
jgi:LysM repeat protein